MIFKRKDSFFLDLSGAGQAKGSQADNAPAVRIAVRAPETTPAQGSDPVAAEPGSRPLAPATAKPAAPLAPPPPSAPMLTTAEAIAAELRAAQEARPAPSSATFAPECLNPANAVSSPRRKAGANLAGFKAMAAEMFRS